MFSSIRTRIKLCGFKDPELAQRAAYYGADAIGLVFYPPSPRAVSTPLAADIVAALPPFVSSVGLFVNADAAEIEAVLHAVPLSLLQFHGEESPAFCAQFGVPYIKAVRVKPDLDLLQYAAAYHQAAGLLCDAWVPNVPGGTGEGFDWGLLPDNLPLPLILSGGLTIETIEEAIQTVQPWAVDVSSGIERQKGIKDLELIQQFIAGVQNAAL